MLFGDTLNENAAMQISCQLPTLPAMGRRDGLSRLFLLAVIAVVIVLVFDYTNGFHDAANIVATVIASRAMTPAQAVVIVGVFEFLGPLLGGTAVANTIGKFVALDGVRRCFRYPSCSAA
jgi:hypothetical protein